MQVGLSHLHDQKFRHSFWVSVNPIGNCGNTIKITKHYLLQYANFQNARQTLLRNVRIPKSPMSEDALIQLLPHGDSSLTDNTNTFFLNSVIEYIVSTKLFKDPLIL